MSSEPFPSDPEGTHQAVRPLTEAMQRLHPAGKRDGREVIIGVWGVVTPYTVWATHATMVAAYATSAQMAAA